MHVNLWLQKPQGTHNIMACHDKYWCCNFKTHKNLWCHKKSWIAMKICNTLFPNGMSYHHHMENWIGIICKRQQYFQLTNKWEFIKHYDKSHSLKPHYPATKTQKTSHVQLLCNYLLGITTRVQLSPINIMH
jgi:hypothetical protein